MLYFVLYKLKQNSIYIIQIKVSAMIKRTNSQEFDQKGNQVPINISINNNNLSRQSVKQANYSIQNNILPNTIKNIYINNKSNDSILEHQQNVDRVHSLIQRPISTHDIKFSQQMKEASVQNQMSNLTAIKRGNLFKMPDSIKESIVNLASGKKPAGSLTASKVSKALFEKYRSFKSNIFICEICSCEYEEKFKTKLSNCNHVFCDSCLRHYVDYKISRFQEVLCPAEGCENIMNINSDFYQSLNAQLMKKYKKVHAFAVVSKNSNSRLCPNQNCNDGILYIQDGVPPKCSNCSKVYCANCMFAAHTGPCQKNQLDFFQNNLHFRQCFQCKNVVEKTIGCNHIKCRCGYEFCYLCGGKWLNYQHKCAITTLQNNIAPPILQAPNIVQVQQDNCCACLQGDGCCASFARILVKILIFPLYLTILLIIIMKSLVLIALLFALTILMGLFPYTFEFICNFGCPWCFILIILYPISMFCGIVMSFRQFFCQAVGQVCESVCQQIPTFTQCFLQW